MVNHVVYTFIFLYRCFINYMKSNDHRFKKKLTLFRSCLKQTTDSAILTGWGRLHQRLEATVSKTWSPLDLNMSIKYINMTIIRPWSYDQGGYCWNKVKADPHAYRSLGMMGFILYVIHLGYSERAKIPHTGGFKLGPSCSVNHCLIVLPHCT